MIFFGCIFAVCVLLWLTSWRFPFALGFQRAATAKKSPQFHGVISAQGWISCAIVSFDCYRGSDPSTRQLHRFVIEIGPDVNLHDMGKLFVKSVAFIGDDFGVSREVRVPWGLPTLLAGVIYGHQIIRRRAQRPGCCAECGYDLRASPNRCPECGLNAR